MVVLVVFTFESSENRCLNLRDFQDKIVIIRYCFAPSDNTNPTHLSSYNPQFTAISELSVDTVHKILSKLTNQSCLLDLWLTFFTKECTSCFL